MRTLAVAAVTAASLALGGCFQSTTVIRVKADGSGTIEQTTMFTEMALAQLRQFASSMGGNGNGKAGVDPFSEDEARKLATALGPGVTYVSSSPVKSADGEGRTSTYAFTDISKLRLSQAPGLPGSASMGTRGSGGQAVTFSIAPQPDGNALLTVHLPEPKMPAPGASGPAPGGSTPNATADQLMMVRQMFAGARMTMAIEPAGRIVKSSSPYVEGSRVTLLDMDFDKVMSNDAIAARLQNIKSIDEARVALKDVPGLKVTLDPEVTVLFSPK